MQCCVHDHSAYATQLSAADKVTDATLSSRTPHSVPCEKALSRGEKYAQIQNTSRYRSLPSRRRADICFLSARAPRGTGGLTLTSLPPCLAYLPPPRLQNLCSATARTLFLTGSCCQPIDGGNRLLTPRRVHASVFAYGVNLACQRNILSSKISA